jgi:acetate CoA/acetoacetate CoA-transferase alpha subunit
MAKIISIEEAIAKVPNGASIMFGGFMGCGNAHKLIDALSKSGKSGFTMICNDGSMPGGPLGEEFYGVAKLIHNHQIKKLIATHVGLNPEVAQQMNAGTMEVCLIPQGSMAEMIRAGGAGLGGVLTPTGVGTIIEQNEFCIEKKNVKGRDYLLMAPLHADFAFVTANKIDKVGNMWYKGDTRNFNTVMATAADCVIAEAENLVEIGDIAPEEVVTSGAYVNYIVDGGNK